jgi:hypothetical protein
MRDKYLGSWHVPGGTPSWQAGDPDASNLTILRWIYRKGSRYASITAAVALVWLTIGFWSFAIDREEPQEESIQCLYGCNEEPQEESIQRSLSEPVGLIEDMDVESGDCVTLSYAAGFVPIPCVQLNDRNTLKLLHDPIVANDAFMYDLRTRAIFWPSSDPNEDRLRAQGVAERYAAKNPDTSAEKLEMVARAHEVCGTLIRRGIIPAGDYNLIFLGSFLSPTMPDNDQGCFASIRFLLVP